MANYWKMLKKAREKNKRLGFGSVEDWKQKEYENERRELLRKKRIDNIKNDNKIEIRKAEVKIKVMNWKDAF